MRILCLSLVGLLILSGCKSLQLDFVRDIPPHTTRPYVLYDVNLHPIEYERHTYHWDKGKLDGTPVTGSTSTLGVSELVCHDLDDLNLHTAWVKRILPIKLRQVLQSHSIAPDHRDAVIRTVEAVLDRYMTVEVPVTSAQAMPL